MFKIDFSQLKSHPLHTSAFVCIFSLLIFLPLIRPPVLLTAVLVILLVYFSMYFGAVFARRDP